MRRFITLFLFTAFLIALTFAIFQFASSRAIADSGGPIVLQEETQDENIRQISAPNTTAPLSINSPDIGFIDSQSATCYQPDPDQNICYINWYYLSVSASPNYMIAMTVTLNTIGNVSYTSGFFQTSMYVPYNMYDKGFKVACGSLGAGGQPNLGNAYAYTIRAKDSSNLSAANYGTVYCPAYIP